jgi:hypothetical protein
VDIPETVDGHSLVPFLRGEEAKPGENCRAWLHGEHHVLGQSLQYITDGKMKYIWWSKDGYEQLFDLVADPGERDDLVISGGHDEALATWRGRLIESLTDREEGFVKDGQLVAEPRRINPCLRHLREAAGLDEFAQR